MILSLANWRNSPLESGSGTNGPQACHAWGSGGTKMFGSHYRPEFLLMPNKRTFRQLVLSILALWRGQSQKEIGAATRYSGKRVSKFLTGDQEIKDPAYGRLLAAIPHPPAAIPIVTACLEALDALDDETSGLTPEERAEIEEGVLAVAHSTRETLTAAIRLSREAPSESYPEGGQASLDRDRAEVLWFRLKSLPEETRLGVVQVAEEFQSWALCERVCAESVTEASRKVERSASLARLAQEIAERVPGPQDWRDRLRGYAGAHAANVLRVSGDLKAAEAAFDSAKRLWHGGADPAAVLDPGRLPDLEASLRRAQRRFGEALALLDEALAHGHSPARVLVQKGFTLEVMGDYERSIETLFQARPLVESQGDPRLTYMVRFNLAVNYCHTGRYGEASELLDQVHELATIRGDENEMIRVTWLQGRIAAGLGQAGEARRLLTQARREFAARQMGYDVALALLEEAALLLGDGRLAEVKMLAQELAAVFNTQGVHREALAALRLFQNAAEREEATAELARRVLRFLFRARYDQGLRFES
jgi:tetratricopeptide (TPR) repeat protein